MHVSEGDLETWLGIRTWGITACNSLDAASKSPVELRMLESSPMAAHRLGFSFDLKATLAARKATLKPLSGVPTLANRLPFMRSMAMR